LILLPPLGTKMMIVFWSLLPLFLLPTKVAPPSFSLLSLPLPVSAFALVVVPGSSKRRPRSVSVFDKGRRNAQGKASAQDEGWLAIAIDEDVVVRSSAGPFVLVRVKGCLFVRPTTSESTFVRPSCKELFIITWASSCFALRLMINWHKVKILIHFQLF
jgi:hypothetical protein